ALAAWAGSKSGKLVSERQFELDHHQVLELKSEFPDSLVFQRFYLVSRRLYETVLFLKADQRASESVALKVLDTFKVLSDAEVTAALNTKAAAAEPSPLPQEPVIARIGSDAEDDGLRGKVKTLLQEDEDLSGTWSVQGRKLTAKEYYNEQGNL